MNIDMQLEEIRNQFYIISLKLNQAEKLKDAVDISCMGEAIRIARKKQKLTRKAQPFQGGILID
jgi:hypothetical protein